MAKISKRMRQVADLIQRQLAVILKQQIQDPRLTNVVLTDVVVSPDLRHAKIYFSVLEEKERAPALSALHNASGHFRYLLAHSIELRYTPTLTFYYDEAMISAERLSALLNKVKIKDDSEPFSS